MVVWKKGGSKSFWCKIGLGAKDFLSAKLPVGLAARAFVQSPRASDACACVNSQVNTFSDALYFLSTCFCSPSIVVFVCWLWSRPEVSRRGHRTSSNDRVASLELQQCPRAIDTKYNHVVSSSDLPRLLHTCIQQFTSSC